MKQYKQLLQHILDNGVDKQDRTNTGVKSVFGYQCRYDLSKGFPIVTTKKIHTKSIIYELLWFLKGDTNIKYLNDNGVHIWDSWVDKYGDLGPIYGSQWRSWGNYKYSGIDQIKNIIKEIKNNPDSRRLIVNSWNVEQIEDMALPPCHCLFQFNVTNNKLNCQLYQRSGDAFLGVPFNIASYALLTHMIAQVCNLEVGEFIHTFGDLHIYNNHLDQVKLQLTRECYELPKLVLNPDIKDIDDFKYEDIKIVDYKFHPGIKGDVSV